MIEPLFLWAGALALIAGAVSIAVLGGAATHGQAARTALLASANLIGALAYVLLATGLGAFDLDADGTAFAYARPLNWAVASLLILTALSLTALPFGRRAPGLIGALLFVDAVMIGCVLVASLATGWTAVLWFAAAAVAFGVVLAMIWSPLRELAHDGHPVRAEIYDRHAGVLSGLWSLYPVAFLLGPSGFGLWGALGALIVFTILDVAAITAYGLLVALEDDFLASHEPAERHWPSLDRPVRAAPAPAPGAAGPAAAGAPAAPGPLRPAAAAEPPRRGPEPPRRPLRRSDFVSARDRLLARYHATAPAARAALRRPLNTRMTTGETLDWLRARGVDVRRFTAGLPAGTRLFVTSRAAKAPPPPPVRRRRPSQRRLLPGQPWPIGALRPSDAVPVAILAVALLIIAWPRGDRRDGTPGDGPTDGG